MPDPPRLGTASVVVRVDEQCIEVLREGVLSRSELEFAAAGSILFVCSGNTCRSPMAERITAAKLAAHLQLSPAELLARGIRVYSAGTGAVDGAPASDHAIRALAEIGLDGSTHRSTALHRVPLDRMDAILCMGRSHLLAVRGALAAQLTAADPARDSTGAGRRPGPELVDLLDPRGLDVADPFAGSLDVYRSARDQIDRAIDERLEQLLALVL